LGNSSKLSGFVVSQIGWPLNRLLLRPEAVPDTVFRQRAGLALEQNSRCSTLEIIVLAVFQRPHKGRKSYQAKPDRDGNEKEEVDYSTASTANSGVSWRVAARSLRPLLPRPNAFATTIIDHADIATAATSGVT